jgi:hypothetical protein
MSSLPHRLFHAFSLRERMLLALFCWSMLIIWLLGLLDTAVANYRSWQQFRATRLAFEEQLAQAPLAAGLLQQARASVDASRTFSAAQLVGQLDTIARGASLSSFDLSIPGTQESDIFSFHTVRLNVKRAQLHELIELDRRIKQHAPYITLSQFQVVSNRRDPRYLDATLELASFELKEAALNE